MYKFRVVVPERLQKRILKSLHDGHPGIQRMKQKARAYVYWPNLDPQIDQLVKQCSSCAQAAKNPIKHQLHSWPKPIALWQRVHMDFAGPINGLYYLIIVDSYSKFPEIQATAFQIFRDQNHVHCTH